MPSITFNIQLFPAEKNVWVITFLPNFYDYTKAQNLTNFLQIWGQILVTCIMRNRYLQIHVGMT